MVKTGLSLGLLIAIVCHAINPELSIFHASVIGATSMVLVHGVCELVDRGINKLVYMRSDVYNEYIDKMED